MARGADDRAVFRTGANTRPADRAQLAHAGRRIQSRFRGSPPPETLLCDGAQLVFRRAVARGRQQFAGGLPLRPQACARPGAPRLPAALRQRPHREVRLDGRRAVRSGGMAPQRPFCSRRALLLYRDGSGLPDRPSRYSAGKALPPGRTATSLAPRRARHSRHGTQTVSGSKSPSKAIRKWMPATRWPTAAPPANRRARHR